jgi:PilZ domain
MEGEFGSERRQLERFSLQAFAVVQTVSAGVEKVYELSTQDISSGGAFFPMEVPLPSGEKLKITLYLTLSAVRDLPTKAKIITEGQVLRSTKQGIAVAFDKHYTLSPSEM